MSEIVIAPFSNSDIRDWPIDRYAALIGLLLARLPADHRIRIVGTTNQKQRGCEIVRAHPPQRVANDCGRFTWMQVVTLLRNAACVISNNSGVGHLSSYFGVPTVCVFGGSHQRQEWRPLGDSVVLVSRAIGCSPCQLDHGKVSLYDKACLREIEPARVAEAAFFIMDRVGTAKPGESPASGRLAPSGRTDADEARTASAGPMSKES